MKDGNTQRRSEETMLCITCRETMTGLAVGTLGHKLSLSYEMEGDYEPLRDSRFVQSYSEKTYQLATEFGKAIESSALYHDMYFLEEASLGMALTSVVCCSHDDVRRFTGEMENIAKSMGADFKYVDASSECSVHCSVTPTIISDDRDADPGYKVCMSYTCGFGSRPLSYGYNMKFVDRCTYEFALAYTEALKGSKYDPLYTFKKTSQGNVLVDFDCFSEDLETNIKHMYETATRLGCKLSFIAFPGGPCNEYPPISLCEYSVR